jgi:hypothetical protein
MTTGRDPRRRTGHQCRSLPIQEWPDADRKAWTEAFRPGVRLKPGGRASHFAEASLKDFSTRYGAYLGFLRRRGVLKLKAGAAAQVTRADVKAYVAELKARVSSLTIWNCIYKLRRASQLLSPKIDFAWLAKIEQELALVMVPRSKFDRLVLTIRIMEAGLTLIAEAEKCAKFNFERARGIRNGLMIVILGLTQIRLKNFVELEIASTFKEVNGSWWICVPRGSTKNKKWVEKRIPNSFNHAIELYLKDARPILMKSPRPDNSLWISSRSAPSMRQRPTEEFSNRNRDAGFCWCGSSHGTGSRRNSSDAQRRRER